MPARLATATARAIIAHATGTNLPIASAIHRLAAWANHGADGDRLADDDGVARLLRRLEGEVGRRQAAQLVEHAIAARFASAAKL